MQKDMLGIVVRKLVTLQGSVLGVVCDLLEKLADPEWVSATKQFLRKENPWGEIPKLLSEVASGIKVPGADRFVAKDHIKAANVGWMGDEFKEYFLNNVEENVPEAILSVHRLERASLDAPIMTELGARKQVFLAQFFELLERQARGEWGLLMTNGLANIAYIVGSDGNFWAVSASWRGVYRVWGVKAHSVGYSFSWGGGDQVLSRDS